MGKAGKSAAWSFNERMWFNIGSRAEYLKVHQTIRTSNAGHRITCRAGLIGPTANRPGRDGRFHCEDVWIFFHRRGSLMPNWSGCSNREHGSLARSTGCLRQSASGQLYCSRPPKSRRTQACIKTPTSQPIQDRSELLLRQTRIRFPGDFGEAKVEIAPIEKGGSDRKFYRVGCASEQTLILVKYNLEREENRHYVEIAQFLASMRGVRVPKIYFHDETEGLIWIEDLGETDLWSYRGESWLVRRALYLSALDEMAKGSIACPVISRDEKRHSLLQAEFNEALYLWEQNYFFENALGRYFGLDKTIAPEKCGTARFARDRRARAGGEKPKSISASRFSIAKRDRA